MYSEIDDFDHHDAEVDSLFNVLKHCTAGIPPGSVLLDIGGGQGMHVWKLQPLCSLVVVADVINYSSLYDGHFLRLLTEKHLRNSRPFSLEKVLFVESDAQNLMFKDELFDCVISLNAFEHIPDPTKAFREALRVTKPGGIVYLQFDPLWTSPTGGHNFHVVPEPWAHVMYSDDVYIEKLRAAGGSDFDVGVHLHGMNRCRLATFEKMFAQAARDQLISILRFDKWPALDAEPHTSHCNFQVMRGRGYSEDELIVRGMRLCARRLRKPIHRDGAHPAVQ
jgi:ubiquinone/menaquinone biosynthesis C-methylase UbiE